MGKVAFVFPGQGSQYVGMGRELDAAFPEAREVFAAADAVLGEPLTRFCQQGPGELLAQTVYTQPAVLATSIACWRSWQARGGGSPDFVAGHSLGEYTALVAAGALSLEEALELVRRRARWMEEACPAGTGGMLACLGLQTGEVEQACQEAASRGPVAPANYNCPGQVVVSGVLPALETVAEQVKSLGGKAVPLAVSGPFHCSLMQAARDKLAVALQEAAWAEPSVTVVPNVMARGVKDTSGLRQALEEQITSPVRWEQSIRWLLEQGVDTFVEMGPGKVLSGLIKRVSRNVKVAQVEDPATLEKTLASLAEGR